MKYAILKLLLTVSTTCTLVDEGYFLEVLESPIHSIDEESKAPIDTETGQAPALRESSLETIVMRGSSPRLRLSSSDDSSKEEYPSVCCTTRVIVLLPVLFLVAAGGCIAYLILS